MGIGMNNALDDQDTEKYGGAAAVLAGRWQRIEACCMRLRTKFIVFVGLVVLLSYGFTFYRTSAFQHQLVLTQVVRQARMLHKQVLLTRKWVADHNGLFVLMQPGVGPNPFLKADTEIVDTTGRHFVKRNPAMVTRELSEYSAREGNFRYRVTTLKPINPANAPDEFERRSLLRFEQEGISEVVEIQKTDHGTVLRYMAPLYVEKACLECHAQQGYREGDIRGGLSIMLPIDWALDSIHANNQLLLGVCVLTVLVVGAVIFLFFDFLVVRRLGLLARAMDRFPGAGNEDQSLVLPGGRDEIGLLAAKFQELCTRLRESQAALDRARERVFQSEKLAAMGRLAAGVAHEINNPLGGMLNCVKTMAENPEDTAMVRRYLALLDKGLHRIAAIVRQLLRFGRRQPLCYRTVDIDELVRECFSFLEFTGKEVELVLDLGLDRPVPVDADALQQVVVNLGLNAMQAMPDGGTLTVQSRIEGDWVVLRFQDTGVGIAAENLSRIFDPFYTTKEVGEGTGLGLSVSYSLVERLGGRISVESTPGQGSCFTVELPVERPTPSAEEG